MITRAQVDANSFLWPDGTVPYSQSSFNTPTGDRADCSGYVGGCCWKIPDKSINTQSLVTNGWMFEIAPTSAKLGDALGLCGLGTLGNLGHIQLFRGWTGAVGGALMIAEQAGGQPGPRHHTTKRPTPGYKFYRFKDIVDVITPPTPTPPEEDEDMKITPLGVYQTKGVPGGDGIFYAWISDGTVYYADTVVGPDLFPRLAAQGFDTKVIYLPKGVTMANVGKPASQ